MNTYLAKIQVIVKEISLNDFNSKVNVLKVTLNNLKQRNNLNNSHNSCNI
jgi:hypothetical protein